MKVSGIFKILITAVACVVIGAIVLNVLLPNVVTTSVNAVEGMIYNATKIKFDFNGDGITGDKNSSNDYRGTENVKDVNGAEGVGVEGFE